MNELLRIAVWRVFKLTCILLQFFWRSLRICYAKIYVKIWHDDLIGFQSITEKKGLILSLDAVNLESALLTNVELLLRNLIHAEQVLMLRNKSVIVARTGLEFADS